MENSNAIKLIYSTKYVISVVWTTYYSYKVNCIGESTTYFAELLQSKWLFSSNSSTGLAYYKKGTVVCATNDKKAGNLPTNTVARHTSHDARCWKNGDLMLLHVNENKSFTFRLSSKLENKILYSKTKMLRWTVLMKPIKRCDLILKLRRILFMAKVFVTRIG